MTLTGKDRRAYMRAYYERNKAKVAETQRVLRRPQRCPTCRGKIVRWPCVLCATRAQTAQRA